MKKLLMCALLGISLNAYAEGVNKTIEKSVEIKKVVVEVLQKNDKNRITNKEVFEGSVGVDTPFMASHLLQTPYIKEVNVNQETGEKTLVSDIFSSGTTIVLHQIKNEYHPQLYRMMVTKVGLPQINKVKELDVISNDSFTMSTEFFVNKDQNTTIKLKDNTELLVKFL